MSLPILPTGPVNIVLPPGFVENQSSPSIKICPTGPSGTIYNENSPTGPGSGHETQPPNQPPGTTQGPTLPGPVIVPSGPSLTGPGPTYTEIFREKHISKNLDHLVIEDPSPDDPYEVNFIPTVVQYESTNEDLLQIDQTDTTNIQFTPTVIDYESTNTILLQIDQTDSTNIKFTPTPINYESTDLDTLTIDQTDPTNIKFTALGGGQIDDIFGNTRTLWVVANNLATTSVQTAITGGITIYPHEDITYTTDGIFTFTKGGYYQYIISGKVPAPGSSGNFAIINFNPDSASLNGGRPSKMANTNIVPPSSFETTANVTNMTGIFTGDTTTFKPTIQTSWNATWTTVNVILATIYGPENAGGGGGGAIEWEIQGTYNYQIPYNFNVDRINSGWYGFEGAPHGTHGITPSHTFTESGAYVGDANNPFWYPNGQMYMQFSLLPRPNLTPDDFTITVEAWDGVVPGDIIIRPNNFNAGIGVFVQGFTVWFPFINGNYIGTSFRLNISITGIVDDHKIYFKYSPVGENGCAESNSMTTFGHGYGDNQTIPADVYGYNWSYAYPNIGPVPFPRRPYHDGTDNWHLVFSHGTIWDDPANLTFEVLEDVEIWTGYYYVDYQLGESLYTTATELLSVLGIQKPVITYIPPTDITTYVHPYPSQTTPVGHWVFTYASDDYFADIIALFGYYWTPPAFPPWYEFDDKWPIMWRVEIKYKGVSQGVYTLGHNTVAVGH